MSNDKAGFYGQIGHFPGGGPARQRLEVPTAPNGLRLWLLPLAAQFGGDFTVQHLFHPWDHVHFSA
jgi:hypothetical protein